MSQANVDRWYPHFDDHPTREAFRVAFDHIYALHDKMQAETAGGSEKATKEPDPGGPSTTKIGGLYVTATPPANGQKLTYNSATGQIEWQ